MLRRLLTIAASTYLLTASVPESSAAQPLVQLETTRGTYEGRVVDKGRGWCVLYDRFGRMHTIQTKDVTRFRKLSSTFAPYSFRQVRSRLLKDFGTGYEVGASRHYIVCAPQGRSKAYADIFESTWRQLHMYFTVRGFQIADPEFPLIAIVFRDQKSFLDHARREKASISPGILGYYWTTHNQVLMYENGRQQAAAPSRRDSSFVTHFAQASDPWGFAFDDPLSFDQLATRAGVAGDLRETMVHEATHQLGYNLGLHNRVGRNPRWMVEGLATVFETSAMTGRRSGPAIRRANAGWLHGFRRFAGTSRPENYLEQYLRSDAPFQSRMANAYAQAWALSFWLIETRPREYGRFLRRMAQDNVSRHLTADRRVEIFKDAFGSNLRMLDAEMLKFYARLK